MSLPFLIPEPFKEKQHGSCRWLLARSDDGERLMIVRTYRTCCFAEYNHSHCKDHDGSAVSFIRQNCVYTAYHASLHAPYPDMCRHALHPKVGERVASIKLRPAGWSFPRQAPIWFKPSANLHSLINRNV